jgi:hypothetical protein
MSGAEPGLIPHSAFVPLRDDERHLFLPMQTIRKLKLPPF